MPNVSWAIKEGAEGNVPEESASRPGEAAKFLDSKRMCEAA